jgi:hypothetical protein
MQTHNSYHFFGSFTKFLAAFWDRPQMRVLARKKRSYFLSGESVCSPLLPASLSIAFLEFISQSGTDALAES